MSGSSLTPVLGKLAKGEALSADEAEGAIGSMMDGAASEAEIGAFLMALHQRGETVAEILGGARALRARVRSVEAPADAIDTCGTGGDGAHTLNISTAAAFVAAGAGAVVAKHGNRAQSSRSGSADVLEALGVRIDLEPQAVSRCIREIGIGFMMAPLHHSAMRHVAPVRKALGFRTLFNLLGPLANPAGTRLQLVGVFDRRWLEPMAQVLAELGSTRAWIVHGSDGLDEITTTGPTEVVVLDKARVGAFLIEPAAFGLSPGTPADLRGGDARENADALRNMLGGAKGAYRDIVLLNAGAALVIAGRAEHLGAGIEAAAKAIDTGSAAQALARLASLSQELGAKG